MAWWRGGQDKGAASLREACLLLLFRRFEIVIILPGALVLMDEPSLTLLQKIAGGVQVLVLSEDPVPTLVPGSVEKSSQHPLSTDRPPFTELPGEAIRVGPIVGYRASGITTVSGKPLKLFKTQSRILWRILVVPHNCRGIADLIAVMPNPHFAKAPHTLWVHIYRLRSKLAALGGEGMLISGTGSYWLQWHPVAVGHGLAGAIGLAEDTLHVGLK